MSILGFTRPSAVVLSASVTLASLAGSASGAVIYSNNFDDGTLTGSTGTPATTFALQGTVTQQTPGDFAVFVDDQSATLRGVVGFRFAGTGPADPVLTYSLNLEGTFAGANINMRSDNLTSNNIGSSAQAIAGSNQLQSALAPGSATADKTLFFLINQGTTDTTYVSPVTSATVTLEAGTLDYFVRDNETGIYTQLVANKVLQDLNGATAGFGELNRWAFGTGGNADTATYQIDDLLLESGINTAFVPEPASLALLGLGALFTTRRRHAR